MTAQVFAGSGSACSLHAPQHGLARSADLHRRPVSLLVAQDVARSEALKSFGEWLELRRAGLRADSRLQELQ